MKKDKFKKMRLQLQTLETVVKKETCGVLLRSLQMELPEIIVLSMETVNQNRFLLKDGTLLLDLSAKGIRAVNNSVKNFRVRKQAEILDYNYFKSRLGRTVVTDVQAEVFDFSSKQKIPFTVKKLEFSFANGKKLDYTDQVSVLSLKKLAS